MPTQFENFMRERHYNRVLRLYTLLNEQSWSRSMTKKDGLLIGYVTEELQKVANDLYLLREELKSEG